MQERVKLLGLLSSPVFILMSIEAHAAGFALIENSASGMGKAFAGSAAVAEDASTVWFNPAGMTYLNENHLKGKSQVSQAGHVINAYTKYKDKGSIYPTGAPTGDEVTSSNIFSFVPNLYVVKPLNEKFAVGLGINGPFGSKTKYGHDWIGRYQATVTDLLAININPSFSYKVNDKLSLGAGLNAQYVNLKDLASAIDSRAACLQIASGAAQNPQTAAFAPTVTASCAANLPTFANLDTDSHTTVSGDNVAFGYNFGLMYKASESTRLGLSYRSKVKHDVDGDIDFDLSNELTTALSGPLTPFLAPLSDRNVKASVTLPPSASISFAHNYNKRLELLGDVTWTGWSTFDELKITEVDGVTPISTVREDWKDVTRVSLGANYKYNDKLTLRTGVAFDEEPIPSPARRTPRIPGNDRTWISIGAGYKVNKKLSLDFGYSHLFLDKTPIDHVDENGYTLKGTYDSHVDIVSAQLNYNF